VGSEGTAPRISYLQEPKERLIRLSRTHYTRGRSRLQSMAPGCTIRQMVKVQLNRESATASIENVQNLRSNTAQSCKSVQYGC
jgi:hypothetical protein